MKKTPKILVFLMVVLLSVSSVTACGRFDFPDAENTGSAATASPKLDPEEVLSELSLDFSDDFNSNVVKRIDDADLTGDVTLIVSLSDESLVSLYNENNEGYGSVSEFMAGERATRFLKESSARRARMISELRSRSLVKDIKYGYDTVLDGFSVTTTYENVEKICAVPGVGRVMISRTYAPCETVENAVNVYDTGIFDSSDVEYTGKGTIVSILDTGCDYTHTAFTSHAVADPLYDRADIERIFPETVAYANDRTVAVRDVYYGNVTAGKIAFGYDYADKDPDIMPFKEAHGTHVAGIIGGSDSTITGVAIDSQLAIMKVFSDYKSGAEDEDILAALEDSVKLEVDAINMSLGTSAGFTSEEEADEEGRLKKEIYDRIEKAGISLIVAASNDYSASYGSEFGNTNRTRNPDSATVGSPSTYTAALSVASINGKKDKYLIADDGREIFFHESVNLAAKEYDFFEMMELTPGITKKYDYVAIPGVGRYVNYIGLDVKGKIALIRRGDISFEDKVRFAAQNGAIAAVIYNNVFGDIIMTVGKNISIPVISIGKDDGFALAEKGTGTLTFNLANTAGPFMSDFSSWGPTPDLRIKPEITAHGGNILSSVPGGGYDSLSGTSMAAPNMCGITVLIRQYVKEKYPELDSVGVRDMVQQLVMSTATIAHDYSGNPYSPRKQGAGLASLYNSVNTKAFLYVDGLSTSKLELGDDPSRTGVYNMSFKLRNISDSSVSYKLGDLTMTESLSTSDSDFVAEMAYMLDNSASFSVEGGTISDGTVTVSAGDTATVKVQIKLSAKDKSYLNANFENGMYVEGFITLESTEANGVDLNIPYLAFYGDWADAPIFDRTYYDVESEAHNDAIDDDDKIKADNYASTPLGKYYYDYVIPLGSYVFNIDTDKYTDIPAIEEHAAISYFADSISGIFGVYTGLLRGAKQLDIEVKNTATGEVVWRNTEYNCYKAYGGRPYYSEFELASSDIGFNNEHFKVTMKAKLDWDDDKRNSNDTFEFSFYIDYELPTIVNSEFFSEYDESTRKNRYYVDLTVYDNHYAMDIRPIVIYTKGSGNDQTLTYTSLSDSAIPVYQESRGSESLVRIEITDYMQRIKESDLPDGMVFAIDDYALNTGLCYVPFPETDAEYGSISFAQNKVNIDINETKDLKSLLEEVGAESRPDFTYFGNLEWRSSDESVAIVDGGVVEGLKAGTATVSVRWYDEKKNAHSMSITVNVSDSVKTDDPNSSTNVSLSELKFTSYNTVFAFNGDIDRSEIGETGSINYFDDNFSLSCYPSEIIKLNYSLKPWNLSPDRYKLTWSSYDESIAKVNQNGEVVAQSKGTTTIMLRIEVDGLESALFANCQVEVKSEFVIENRELVAYKGWGGDVVIPDDEGILYIGSFAFCHYDMVNDREVEDKYDIDAKKDPLGNDTVVSVVIPDGVEEVRKFAFYHCTALKNVTLPASCKNVLDYVFCGDTALEFVNLDNVLVIGARAFFGCVNLSSKALLNTRNVRTIGTEAFSGSGIRSADLTNLSWCGSRAFGEVTNSDGSQLSPAATKLSTIVVGEKTQLSESMFDGCGMLKTITGKIYADQIPDRAFANTIITNIVFASNLTYLGSQAFDACKQLSSVTFEGKCEYIGDSAFAGCIRLTEFALPEGDVSLGGLVFASYRDAAGQILNSALETLKFGKTTRITDLDIGIFSGCDKLSAFAVTNSDYYTVKAGMLFSKAGKTLVLAPPNKEFDNGTYTLPDEVETVGMGAFAANRNLTSFVTTSNSKLKLIEKAAFSGCTELTSVKLPESCTEIGDSAFFADGKLANMDTQYITGYGAYSLYNTAVTSLMIADGAHIGELAFSADVDADGESNSKLESVEFKGDAVIEYGAFLLSVNLNSVTIANDAKLTLNDAAFAGCSALENLDLTRVYGAVGANAFLMCESLQKAELLNATSIGANCFAGCAALTDIKLPQVTYIGDTAFGSVQSSSDSPKVVSLELPELTEVGDAAFDGLVNLTTLNMPKLERITAGNAYASSDGNSVTYAGAFSNCTKLVSVDIGRLARLEDLAFFGCTNLAAIDGIENVTYIGAMALGGTKIESIDLENCLEIGIGAFTSLNSRGALVANETLKSVTANKLTTLGYSAFESCTALASVELKSVKTIASGAFNGCTSLTNFTISDSFENIDYMAFADCDKLTAITYKPADGDKLTDTVKTDAFILDKGVLYTVLPNGGYMLSAYPVGKTDKEYTVIEGTRAIEYGAAAGNESLEKVILPTSLRTVGDAAFFGCTNLKEVEFRSYYAPTLEGTPESDLVINAANIETQYPKYRELYKYNYSLRQEGGVRTQQMFFYKHFVDIVASKNASHLVYVYPEDSSGYTAPLYRAYFNKKLDDYDRQVFYTGETVGRFALAFLDACEDLPKGDTATRFDGKSVLAVRAAYNALINNANELKYVQDNHQSLINKFLSFEQQYNADVIAYDISYIFDIDNSEYTYNKIRDIWRRYNYLTDEEKALITDSKAVFDAKIEELKAVMPGEFDLNKPYSEYVFLTPSEDEGGCGCGSAAEGAATLGGALFVCAVAAAAVILGRKRRISKQ